MIVEGLVTTRGAGGSLNVSPMGPLTDAGLNTLVFRPFRSSRTYQNLREHPEGVFHVTDDAELIARCVLGPVEVRTRPASCVRGEILEDACRYFEFRVTELDDRQERTRIEVEIVERGELRPFLGFNRARHAVVEAAILASRVGILPRESIETGFEALRSPVDKTGGEAELRAFELLERHALGESGSARSLALTTGSRLHFGLLAPGPGTGRRFGGLGLMVDRPRTRLLARPADHLEVRGPGHERVRKSLEALARSLDVPLPDTHAFEVEEVPPSHRGLGSGTQLGLAAARLALRTWNLPDLAIAELAPAIGRGRRSAIGAHGFEQGGFLLDGGHAMSGEAPTPRLAPLLSRVEFPGSWPLILVSPPGEPGQSGQRERESFEVLESRKNEAPVGDLCQEVLLELLPALVERDFGVFSRSLGRLQRRVGELFAPVQGGCFAHPRTARLVDFLERQGIEGAGQSSWGPTVFAVVDDEDRAHSLVAKLRAEFELGEDEVLLTRARNRGASIDTLPDP